MAGLINPSNFIKNPIQDGDCGVVLRADGNFEIFSTGIINPDELTPVQLEQGIIMTAIALCLENPKLRESLIKLATDMTKTGEPLFSNLN